MFDFLLIPMGYILRFAYSITHNYLFAIFFFTLVFEILLLPIAIKQQKNQIRQARLAPKVSAIQKKYKGRKDQATQQKMQQEIMDMYQQENFNPMGGCLPLLIQMPIIFCLYSVITQPLRYICNIPVEEINALKQYFVDSGVTLDARNLQINIINLIRDNVSQYFSIAPSLEGAVIPDFSIGPFDLSRTPEISLSPFNWLMFIPIITFVVMIVSQKIMQRYTYQSPESQAQQNSASMKIMMWTMPLMSVFIEFSLAAAIGVYWIFRNMLQTIEKIIIAKIFPIPKLTDEDFKEAEKAVGAPKKEKKEKKQVRSLHHIDDEEYIARHREAYENSEQDDSSTDKDTKKNAVENASGSSDAPAPIKDDEKTSYRKKK